jgi:hypothetical protein
MFERQALLKRVLLAYARWNKAVGYCQGLNVLAALLLEVMNRSEAESLKVCIVVYDKRVNCNVKFCLYCLILLKYYSTTSGSGFNDVFLRMLYFF